MIDNKVTMIELDNSRQIVISTWCVECEKDEWATRIYKGNSLCERHFKETKGKQPPIEITNTGFRQLKINELSKMMKDKLEEIS